MSESYDMAVVGAGASGIAAALASARLGAKVALVETSGRIGGAGARGLHRFICGLFTAGGETPGDFLHGETVRDFCSRLAGGDPVEKAVRRGRVWLLPFGGGAALETCARESLGRAPGLRLFMGESPIRLDVEYGRVGEVVLSSGTRLRVRSVVDATGTAATGCLAGGAVDTPAEPALAGYGFRVRDVREAEAGPLGLAIEVPRLLRRAVEEGRIPDYLALTAYEPGEGSGWGWIKMALPSSARDSARREAETVFGLLKSQRAFQAARVTEFLPEVLERESVHLRGRYCLTGSDVRSARTFSDGIARNAWPLERWMRGTGVRYEYLPDGQWCDIPLRCLQPEGGPENLLVAGAALSADSEAAASLRAMGVCMATGEAAARFLLGAVI